MQRICRPCIAYRVQSNVQCVCVCAHTPPPQPSTMGYLYKTLFVKQEVYSIFIVCWFYRCLLLVRGVSKFRNFTRTLAVCKSELGRVKGRAGVKPEYFWSNSSSAQPSRVERAFNVNTAQTNGKVLFKKNATRQRRRWSTPKQPNLYFANAFFKYPLRQSNIKIYIN